MVFSAVFIVLVNEICLLKLLGMDTFNLGQRGMKSQMDFKERCERKNTCKVHEVEYSRQGQRTCVFSYCTGHCFEQANEFIRGALWGKLLYIVILSYVYESLAL